MIIMVVMTILRSESETAHVVGMMDGMYKLWRIGISDTFGMI